jgi:YD repeat-containing protein
MSIYKLFSQCRFLNLIIRVLPIFFVMSTILFKPCSVVWAQTYNIQNDRILAPEVSHFTGVKEPGVDAHGDLLLSISLMTVPGRDGLNFDLVANYSSGIKVTQSASWIGWGWSLDVGSITRHPLGGLDRWHFNDRNGDGQSDAEQVDFALALSGQTRSQPDAYTVTMSGNTVDLISTTLGVIPTPSFIFDPHQTENYGSCGPGTATHSRWHFTTSPWRPWKFCRATSNPVPVDCRSTGTELGTREDISKLIITTEDGTRYIYGMPTLSYASLPPDHQTGTNYSFVSTWRLIAIHAPNYSGSEIPTSTSTGGWVKIVYKTVHSQTGALVDVETISDGPTCSTGNIIQQITYPYYIETPTHYALFATSKRYDRDLVKGGLGGAGVDANYYSRKLDKITLYKKTEPGGAIPNSTDNPVLEVAFTYMNNGANSLVSSYTPTIHGKMLSKLTLEKITITGLQSNGQGQVTATQSLPSYKFSYYDYKDVNPNDPTGGWLSWDDVAGNPSIHVLNYQDDFGFLDFPPGDSRRNSNEAYGTAWSLKEITYPDGGRQRIIYESDKIGTGGVSPPPSFTYNVYTVCGTQNATYQANLSASFSRTFQGGPRVKAIRRYSGYNESTPDSVSFTYGEGFYSGISEGKFLKIDNGSEPFYVSGDRGQFNITYAWIEKKLLDNSKIRTHYVTGNGPEFQIFYKGGVSGPTRAILYGNTRWNWGEIDSVQHFDASSTLVKKEVNYWSFYGTTPSDPQIAAVAPSLCYGGTTCPQGSCSQGTPEIYLNFTHKQLNSVVTKNYFGSTIVTSRVDYEYNDGTLLSKTTETSAEGKKRNTENTYAHDLSGAPYSGTTSGMRYKNMRSQVAQTSVTDNNPTNNGYASTVTTWKDVGGKYLPDKEYRWRNNTTSAAIPSFNWSNPDTNIWTRMQTFLGYDAHGNLTRIHDGYASETTVHWNATGTLIDSITTRPNAATTLTTRYAYDPNTFRLTSITDPNNQKTRFKYDPLQRLIETIMPDKRTASDFAYYYSRQGVNNNDAFNPTDPNYIKTRSMTGPGFFEPFEYTDSPTNHGWVDHVGPGNGTMSTVYDTTLQSQAMRVDVLPGYANDSYAVRYPATGELGVTSTHLWVKVKNSFATSSFRLVVRYANQDYFLVYYFDGGTNYYDIPSRSVVVYAGTIYKDGAWHTLERDLEQDFNIASLGANYEYIKRIIVRGEYDLDDIQLLNHPVATLSLADGIGRDIQTLQYDKGGSVKSGIFYDAFDRVTKVTKPFFHANTKFTRVDSVIAYANNYYSTQHPVYYDGPSAQEYDTGNYAYSETEYYPDPLNRVRHQYFPGAVFSRADTNYVNIATARMPPTKWASPMPAAFLKPASLTRTT